MGPPTGPNKFNLEVMDLTLGALNWLATLSEGRF